MEHKGILGLPDRGVSDDFVRAELGLERLSARWDKLRLGYWHKLCTAGGNRALSKVVAWRRQHIPPATAQPQGSGWMQTSWKMLEKYGLIDEWRRPDSGTIKRRWKHLCYSAVDSAEELAARKRMQSHGMSMVRYEGRLKEWGETPARYAAYAGEVERRGSCVMERYLDAWDDAQGTKLKLLCRGGLMPLLSNVGRDNGWTQDMTRCQLCEGGEAETLEHFLLSCARYDKHRRRAIAGICRATGEARPSQDMLRDLMLGKRTGSADADARIDVIARQFLREAWHERRCLTRTISEMTGRADITRHRGWRCAAAV